MPWSDGRTPAATFRHPSTRRRRDVDADDPAHRCGHDRGRVSGDPACSPGNTHDPPAADLPPEVKAFFGTWEGTWDGVLPSRLVVEEIDATSARVVYAWADHPQGRFKGGWSRVRASVLPGGTLQWGSDVKFTFKMTPDRRSIEGAREEAGHIALVTMQKLERE
jgi:hypothetical protein